MRRCYAFLALLFVAHSLFAQQSKNVRLLCNWQDTTNCPVNPGGQHWNDVWGFTVKGKEYAVIGGTTGAHIIDIDACEERAYLPAGTSNVIHRDYKTYKHYLYCVADEDARSALLIYDISYLPDSVKLIYTSNRLDLNRAHNIFIDTAKARLYFGIETDIVSGTHDMSVWSLANPERPEWIVDFDNMGPVHDMYVRNDTAWCSNSWNGYVVMDMSALPTARTLGGLSGYPYKGYNHSSWMGYDYIGVMADETFGMPLKVIDAKDPTNIKVLSTFGPRGTDSTSLPHNPYLLGHYAFVSYYMDGLQIYDLTDPKKPVQAGYYDTYPQPDGQLYAGAWGCYPYLPSGRVLVSDMQTGLYVFDVREVLKVHEPKTTDVQLYVYPNPAETSITVDMPQALPEPLSGGIYDVTGRLVMPLALPRANARTRLSLPPDMAPGLYFLRAEGGGQRYAARFTKR